LLFAILALGPLLALGLLDYVHARRAVERIIVDQTAESAKRAAAMILDRYALMESDALLLSDNAETQGLLAALAAGDSGRVKAASASVDTFARTVWQNAGSAYRSIELRDRLGAVLLRLPTDTQPTGSGPEDNAAARAAARMLADSERAADEGLPPIEFPVAGATAAQGFGRMVMRPRATTILPAQLRSLAFGRAGYLLVIDSLRQIVYDSRVGGSGLPIAEIIRSNKGSAVLKYAVGDSARLASTETVPALGWTVLSSAAISEFATGLNSARLLALALVIALAVGVAIAFTILVGRTTRSLEELTLAARAVGHGDLTRRLPAASDDEIGTLAGAFHHMLGRVRTTMREIEVSRQLAVLGEFSAQLAHEIRNPLTSLKLNLQGLSREVQRGTLSKEAGPPLDTCLREVNRLDSVVHDVLELARPRSAARTACSVHAVLNRVVEVHAQRLESAGLSVVRELEATRDVVQGDPEQLVGLFTNLVVNAVDAQPEGGRLLLRTRSNGTRIKVVVADGGPGVAAELTERIFRPFVTGKVSGTGLGLPMALNVARDHGGTLELVSAPDGFSGAAFRVTLPFA
jgi:signal transduction histidine kinase